MQPNLPSYWGRERVESGVLFQPFLPEMLCPEHVPYLDGDELKAAIATRVFGFWMVGRDLEHDMLIHGESNMNGWPTATSNYSAGNNFGLVVAVLAKQGWNTWMTAEGKEFICGFAQKDTGKKINCSTNDSRKIFRTWLRAALLLSWETELKTLEAVRFDG